MGPSEGRVMRGQENPTEGRRNVWKTTGVPGIRANLTCYRAGDTQETFSGRNLRFDSPVNISRACSPTSSWLQKGTGPAWVGAPAQWRPSSTSQPLGPTSPGSPWRQVRTGTVGGGGSGHPPTP